MPPETLPFDFSSKPPPPATPQEPVLSVGDLDRVIRTTVDGAFGRPVSVEGEVVSARPAASGHVYFTLKDEREDASIDVVIYRTSLSNKGRELIVDGARIRLRGKPTFWAPRGRLQFVADRVQPAGRGALLEALEKLKEKLAAEGLFAPERKRELPLSSRIIGVVTSAHGAAIHDICRVAFERGGAHILLSPALVQGAGAAASMTRALQLLEQVAEVSVIILGRGGGASEDLAAFNDEALVRAVAACRVPVVSAVGHEVDITLTDLAADARAATPSQAAELLVPHVEAQREALHHLRTRLARGARALLNGQQLELGRLERRFRDPRLLLAGDQQSLDDWQDRLETVIRSKLEGGLGQVAKLERELIARHPKVVIERQSSTHALLTQRLANVWQSQNTTRANDLARLAGRLNAMSPLSVLSRGYAIVTRPDGRALRTATDAQVGDTVRIRAHTATLSAVVTEIRGVIPNEVTDPPGTAGLGGPDR